MENKIVMPKIGKSMTEGTIVSWEKKPGDYVEDDEVLFVMYNGKSNMEIESMVSGTLKSITVPAGQAASVGAQIAIIDESASAPTKEQVKEAVPAKSEDKSALNVTVVGGGPGGYVAAIRAAQLGAKVTLVEKAKIGGTCLNCGCMPTKALMHASEIYEEAVSSAEIGISAKEVEVDWTKVQANRAGVSEKLTAGVRALIKANKITLIEGDAVFTGPKSVQVNGKVLDADRVIIASGSRPIIPNIPGVKESKYVIDSTGCLTLDHIPESLFVIGGGVIGLELGSVYARFGTKVTVVEMMPTLLPLMDDELTAMLRAQLEAKGIEIYTDSKVESISDLEYSAKIEVSGPAGKQEFTAEKVLICTGRGPNTDGLGLDKAGITLENGFIPVNEKMETAVQGVYAAGDCNGKLMLAHAAMAMGETAAENAMGGNSSFDPINSPSCAYVGPEYAGVGFTEKQLKEMKIDYKVGRFPTSANGKSLVMGHTDGMVKVLAGKQYGEILGVHILAPRATDLIEEAALAIKLECTLEEFIGTVHCHPTVAEAVREGAMAADKRAVHIPNKK